MNIFQNIITSGQEFSELDTHKKYKYKLINSLFIIGATFGPLVAYLRMDDINVFIANIIITFICLSLLISLRFFPKKLEKIIFLANFTVLSFFIIIFIIAGEEHAKITWFFLVMTIAYFTSGVKFGHMWTTIAILSIWTMHIQPYWETYYTTLEIIVFTLSLSATAFVISYSEKRHLDDTDILKSLNEDLKKLNEAQELKLHEQARYASMGEMIANIAHQWKQPLNFINLNILDRTLELAQGEMDTKKLQKSFDDINRQTKYLTDTIEDFRTFFTADAKSEVQPISETIEHAIKLVELPFAQNNIKLIFNNNLDDQTNIKINNRFSHVLINLFNNAKDAIVENIKDENAKKVIYIETNMIDKDNIKIDVCDNGGGVLENIKTKIFDPYITSKHKSQGTGLGLYMTKEIMNRHIKGRIEVENENFKVDDKEYFGACFKITIPTEKRNNLFSRLPHS